MAPILPASISIPAIAPPSLMTGAASPSGGAFQSAFADAVSKVETFQSNAKSSVDRFLSGEGEELHHVAIAAQQAELSFQLFMQVRNKIVTAYQQVMQMQV
ncbi:MAG TPA: flagellar hook-basal body complex protein FliE [Candidatus Limnocylindrales bacterium]|nr:flagellar hook-basal body complex protein FliE [Candidatus Limnocylindrales bacterium]